MKKWLVIVAVGAAAACAIVASRRRSAETQRPTMWEKMRARMEEMPEDFPPRIMFDNAQAARENTERILEILEQPAVVPESEQLTGASV